MQETRDDLTSEIRQRIFTGKTIEELQALMDADVHPGETVVRRREMTQAEFHGANRHERRKYQAMARRKR